MKTKIKIQLGAFDNKKHDYDIVQLTCSRQPELLSRVLEFLSNKKDDLKCLVHRLPDGGIHLMEWDVDEILE